MSAGHGVEAGRRLVAWAARRGVATLAVTTAAVVAAQSPAQAANPEERDEIARAWCARDVVADPRRERAVRACRDWLLHLWSLDAERMDVGYLWILRKLTERSPEPAIEDFVRSWAPSFRDGRGAIVYPDAPKRWLPKDPGHGLERFRNWVSAASGRPASRAIRFIDAYTSIEATGYVLSHQLLVLVWARDAGLELPAELHARAPGLLKRILAEHRSDARAGDLDFERAMILLMYADVDSHEAEGWIERILAAWDPLARRWTFEASEAIHFDGHTYKFGYTPHHPTAMALGAVKTYLARFAQSQPVTSED